MTDAVDPPEGDKSTPVTLHLCDHCGYPWHDQKRKVSYGLLCPGMMATGHQVDTFRAELAQCRQIERQYGRVAAEDSHARQAILSRTAAAETRFDPALKEDRLAELEKVDREALVAHCDAVTKEVAPRMQARDLLLGESDGLEVVGNHIQVQGHAHPLPDPEQIAWEKGEVSPEDYNEHKGPLPTLSTEQQTKDMDAMLYLNNQGGVGQ